MKAIAEKKSEKFDFNRIQTNVPPRFKLHGHSSTNWATKPLFWSRAT